MLSQVHKRHHIITNLVSDMESFDDIAMNALRKKLPSSLFICKSYSVFDNSFVRLSVSGSVKQSLTSSSHFPSTLETLFSFTSNGTVKKQKKKIKYHFGIIAEICGREDEIYAISF